VFISHGVGDLLNTHVAGLEVVCGFPQPLSCQQFSDANARLLLEKVLQVRGTQVHFDRESLDRVKLLRLDHLDYFA